MTYLFILFMLFIIVCLSLLNIYTPSGYTFFFYSTALSPIDFQEIFTEWKHE